MPGQGPVQIADRLAYCGPPVAGQAALCCLRVLDVRGDRHRHSAGGRDEATVQGLPHRWHRDVAEARELAELQRLPPTLTVTNKSNQPATAVTITLGSKYDVSKLTNDKRCKPGQNWALESTT
ncbi:hypothetical protein ACFC5Z_12810 [Streptomyces sp. NPDC056004]|uniref:hypothetical protein n=1 Tax=Streptomyces sp. NPDC056004 TaxID=3345677 RepID=UPI0035D84D47